MKKFRATLPVFLLLFLLWAVPACDSDDDEITRAPVGISGQVVDAAGDPVADVAIGLVYSLEGLEMPGDWEKGIIRPFEKPFTQIKFDLPEDGPVTLEIFDYAGDLVKVLLDGETTAGQNTVTWDTTNDQGERVPSGMYYAHITLPDTETQVTSLFLYLFEDGEILAAPHTVTDSTGRFTINGALIPVGAELSTFDETGQATGTTTVRSAILVKAVLAGQVQPTAMARAVDWVPNERLSGLKFILP